MFDDHPLRATLDWTAAGLTLGTLTGILPTLAAVLSIIWFLVRIAESDTFYHFTGWRPWRARPTERKDKSNGDV